MIKNKATGYRIDLNLTVGYFVDAENPIVDISKPQNYTLNQFSNNLKPYRYVNITETVAVWKDCPFIFEWLLKNNLDYCCTREANKDTFIGMCDLVNLKNICEHILDLLGDGNSFYVNHITNNKKIPFKFTSKNLKNIYKKINDAWGFEYKLSKDLLKYCKKNLPTKTFNSRYFFWVVKTIENIKIMEKHYKKLEKSTNTFYISYRAF